MTPKLAFASFALLVLIAAIDYATDFDLILDVFYLAPAALMAWAAGRRAGIGMALLAALTWSVMEWLDGHPYAQEFYLFCNGLGLFVVAAAVGWMTDRLRRATDDARRMAELVFSASRPANAAELEAAASAAHAWMRKIRREA